MKKMKRVISSFLVVSLLMTGCVKTEKSYSMAEDVEDFVENVDLEFAFDLTEDLATNEDLFSNKMGFRTSGSDAEHKTADYLVKKMQELGLEDVEKMPFTVDKWQFNSASFKMQGVEEFQPVSYAAIGTDAEGITAEVVNVGKGTVSDYEGKDVQGKIVLASVDQWNENWINSVMEEAKVHGAAAILTYAHGGYSQVSDDAINMQDSCANLSIPSLSISKNQAMEIIDAAKPGIKATLIVDNEMVDDGGTSYNVVGKIKGKFSDQQMILSAHYDTYFTGFQDDCAAIGLIFTIAKAMKDSSYQPENDILFVCHAAEEWGTIGSEFDWAVGSWNQINKVTPNWADKTIAVFNFELPAYDDNAEMAQIRSVPEFSDFVKFYVEESGFALEGTNPESKNVGTYDDNISYRFAGIPTFVNLHNYGNGWYLDNYHTAWDNSSTFNEDVMDYNIKTYGSLAILLDQMPAVPFDFERTYSDLKDSISQDVAKASGVDVDDLNNALEEFKTAAASLTEEINEINSAYQEAYAKNNQEDMDQLRIKGKKLNKKTKKVFKMIQNEFIWVIGSADVYPKHGVAQDNILIIEDVIKALENNDITEALDLAWNINGGIEWTAYEFSKEVVETQLHNYTEETNPNNLFWGTGKVSPMLNTYEATMSLLNKEDGDDITTELSIYSRELTLEKENYKKLINEQITALQEIVDIINMD